MVAVHVATMACLRRLKGSDNIPQLEANGNLANKLARTYAAQLESLKRYRSKAEQKVTVEHVTVNAGGRPLLALLPADRGCPQNWRVNHMH